MNSNACLHELGVRMDSPFPPSKRKYQIHAVVHRLKPGISPLWVQKLRSSHRILACQLPLFLPMDVNRPSDACQSNPDLSCACFCWPSCLSVALRCTCLQLSRGQIRSTNRPTDAFLCAYGPSQGFEPSFPRTVPPPRRPPLPRTILGFVPFRNRDAFQSNPVRTRF